MGGEKKYGPKDVVNTEVKGASWIEEKDGLMDTLNWRSKADGELGLCV